MYIRYLFLIIALFTSFSSVSSAQWVQEKNVYPGGVDDAMVSFVIGDTVYIGGGSNGSTSFYKFDPATGTWTPKKSLPRQMAFGVSFSIGSKGYAALGQSDPTNANFANAQGSVQNDLWEYDPASDTWTAKANFPGKKRDAAFAFVMGTKGFVGGGFDSTSTEEFGDFFSYDPASNAWTPLNNLPDYLAFSSTFTISPYGYVALGVDPSAELTSLWQYDPSQDSWNQMSDFPGVARQSPVAFALNGEGLVGLGQSQYTSVFKDFYSYDPSKDSWTQVTSFPAAHGRGWSVGVTVGNEAIVGLGSYFTSTINATNDIWEYTPSAAAVDAQMKQISVSLYPNPTSSNIRLSFTPKTSAHIIVQNSLGQVCLTSDLSSGSELNIASLPAGIYEVGITSSDFHSTERFVKQ